MTTQITHVDRSARLRHRDKCATIRHSATSLESETQAYIDRVEQDGGTVHDQGWVNTMIHTLKGLGVYSDCVFLGDANMGTDVASTGSAVGTLYDASGGARDMGQSNSSAKPSLTTDTAFAGEKVLAFDGTDDRLEAPDSSVWSLNESGDSGFVIASIVTQSEHTGMVVSKNQEWAATVRDGVSGDSANEPLLGLFGDNSGGGAPVSVGTRAELGYAWDAGGGGELYIDGASDLTYSTSTTNTDKNRKPMIGDLDASPPSIPLDAHMSTIIVIAARPSDSDVSSLSSTLDTKFS